MSVREELKRLDEARDKGAISRETYKKLRQQITDLVEDADVVATAPKPPPPKPSPARPRAAYSATRAALRTAPAKEGVIVGLDLSEPSRTAAPPAPRNLWRDAGLAALVITACTLVAGWLLGDVILALTIALALLCLALVFVARRLVEEDKEPAAAPSDDEQLET